MMSPTIPLFSARLASEGLDLRQAVQRVLDSHWYVLGREVEAFEAEFASYCGSAHCVTLANGTDALELGLRALGVGAGDVVFMAANAGFYGSTACHLVGGVPRYIDVDADRLTLSAAALEAALAVERPKAIIVTHLYGQLADIESIMELARNAGVPVLEDVAQAHGARRGDRRAGTFGQMAAFSFYPTKNLGALGDGGAITTDDETLAATVRQLRQYGWGSKYRVERPMGRNSRLDEMQAAILREKLPRLDEWNAQRRSIAQRYNAAFEGSVLRCPSSVAEDYVAHLYVVRVAEHERERFRAHLLSRGVASDVHYPVADHHQPAYGVQQAPFALEQTERACREVVTLPCFPGLSEQEVGQVIEAVHAYLAEHHGAAPC